MTDLSFRDTRRLDLAVSRPTTLVWLVSGVALASAAGFLLGHAAPGDGGGVEPTLVALLRFMAVLKFAGVVGAAALVAWRLTRTTPRALALAYGGAVTLMAFAPGLIWSLAHVGLAAGLFHVGLLGFLVLAWKDQDAIGPLGRRSRV